MISGFGAMTSLTGGGGMGDLGGAAGPANSSSAGTQKTGGFNFKSGGTNWTTIAMIIGLVLVALVMLKR